MFRATDRKPACSSMKPSPLAQDAGAVPVLANRLSALKTPHWTRQRAFLMSPYTCELMLG